MELKKWIFDGEKSVSNKSKGKMTGKLIKLFLIILLTLSAVLFTLKFAIPDFNFHLPFIYTKNITATEIILKKINKISTLSTVEYIYKSVFPYDFIEKDTPWRKILSKRIKGDDLTETENENLWIFDLCQSIGINLEYDTYDFVVITSIVKAGFNLENTIGKNNIIIDGKNITLKIPGIIITKFTIEDTDSTRYSYPDLDVDPMNWKKITDYVERKTRIRVIEDGILKNAEERGKDFIRSILIESGWDNIIFVQ